MIQSFLRLSLRNLFHENRLFTVINISGLAIGLGSMLLVALFIHDEYNFDKYHKNADRIFRIVMDFTEEGNTVNWAKTSAPIGQYLTGSFPEIEQVVRIRKNPGTDLLSVDDIKFYEERLFFADSSLFKVFDFPLLKGNPYRTLTDKNSIVINEGLAKKYFNETDPIGKTLRLNNLIDLKITGVMGDVPANSHFVADAFITFSSLENSLGEKRLTHWGWMDHFTYVLLAKGSSPEKMQAKFPEFLKTNAPEWAAEKEKLFLQALTSIHLHSSLKDEASPNSNEYYSYILGTISIFILLMACANFINLSTATLVSRFKEISIQKALGASAFHLSLYFWIESVLTCAAALAMSYLLVWVVLPYFNLITGKQILLNSSSWLLVPSLALATLIGFLSGIIPAIQAGKLNVLRITRSHGTMLSKTTIRTSLITFQFCISILLITATWIVSSQIKFLKSSRFGFNSEHIVVVPVKDRSKNDKHSVFVNEISQIPGVAKVSYSSSMPAFNNAYTYTYTFAGSNAGEQTMAAFLIDENFFSVYNIELKDGRLPTMNISDTIAEVIINEAAVKQLQIEDPIGQVVTGQVNGRVVGIVKDFNYESLHSPIKPVIMYSYSPNFRFVSVKFIDGEFQSKLTFLEKRWQELYPGYPLEYFFLDDKIDQFYASEFQLSKAYTSFTLIAIIIAGSGLIGLTTYLLTRKLKEISIRKVFGSSTAQLVGWIYSSYFKIIIIATIIAWGLSYYWMSRWLEGFAFKTELKISYFVYPALIMTFILLATTIIQTVKASGNNPVINLREEN